MGIGWRFGAALRSGQLSSGDGLYYNGILAGWTGHWVSGLNHYSQIEYIFRSIQDWPLSWKERRLYTALLPSQLIGASTSCL